MEDPIDIFFTMKSVILDFQNGKGCRLGHVPACVSAIDGVQDAAKRRKEENEDGEESDTSSDEDSESSDEDEDEDSDAEKTDLDSDTEREQREEKKRARKERKEKLVNAFQDMQNALQRKVPHSYCCGGSIPLPALLEERRAQKEETVPIETFGLNLIRQGKDVFATHDLLCLNLSGLRDLTSPSGFGDLATQQTRVDESVRKARELKLDWLCFKQHYGGNKEADADYDLRLSRFQWYVNSLLTNCGVSLQLHKLNLYEEGGFFQPHVDTPTHGSKQLGTFLLCLPVEHTGGELIVRHAGKSHTFDFAPQSKDCLQWCAFFGDCIHEVKPVTSGTRVTLTFDIIESNSHWDQCVYKPFACEQQFHQPLDMSVSYLQTRFDPVLSNLCELLRKDSKYVGLLLEHRYPLDICDQPTHLKGKDALLYQHVKKRYDVTIQTVVYNESYSYYDKLNLKEDRSAIVFRFTQADYEAYKSGSTPPPSDFPDSIPFIPMMVGRDHALQDEEQEGAEYAGNEALKSSTDVVYYHAALLVKIYSSHKRQKRE